MRSHKVEELGTDGGNATEQHTGYWFLRQNQFTSQLLLLDCTATHFCTHACFELLVSPEKVRSQCALCLWVVFWSADAYRHVRAESCIIIGVMQSAVSGVFRDTLLVKASN